MNELRLAVSVAEAAIEAAGLIVRKARAGRHLKPLLLARSPKLEVIALGGRKAHIAAAELENAVVEPKTLQNSFGLLDENLKLREALFSVRLRNEQVVGVHAEFLCIEAVKSVLCIDDSSDTALLLHLSHSVDGEGRFT